MPEYENGYIYTIYDFKSFPNTLTNKKGVCYIYLNGYFHKYPNTFLKLKHLGGGERFSTESIKSSNIFIDFILLVAKSIFKAVFKFYWNLLNFKKSRKSTHIKKDFNPKYNIENYSEKVKIIEIEGGYILKDFNESNLPIRTLEYENESLIKEVEFTYDDNRNLKERIIRNIKNDSSYSSKISHNDSLVFKEEIISEVKKRKTKFELYVAHTNIKKVTDSSDFYSITCKKNGEYFFIITKSLFPI
jgi:hypothetical protein